MKKYNLALMFFSVLGTVDVYAVDKSMASSVNYSSNFLQMMIGLFFIIFMIFAVVWLMKKVGYKTYGTSGPIKIISCLPISTKEKILLIEVGEEQVLVGTAPGFIGHIKTIKTPISDSIEPNKKTVYRAPPEASAFAEKLKLVLNKNEMI